MFLLFTYLLFFRYVSALSDPESYLGSKNVPDVCVLIEKASNCVSSETAYDWYDHFKKNCQNWPVVYQLKETAKQLKEAKSTRKEPPATQSKKVRELNLSFKHLFSYFHYLKLLMIFDIESNFILKPVNVVSIHPLTNLCCFISEFKKCRRPLDGHKKEK